MIDMFDRDNTKSIDVTEFSNLWRFLGEWRKVFDRFDADRSGNISMDELAQAFQMRLYKIKRLLKSFNRKALKTNSILKY